MQLDNYTAITIVASTSTLFGLGMVLFSSLQKTFKGFAQLGAAFMAVGIGAGLVVLRGQIPDIVSIALSNALLVAAVFSMEDGLSRFTRGKPGHFNTAVICTVGTFIATYYFSAIQPDLRTRIVIMSLAFALPTILGGYAVLAPVDGKRHISQFFTAAASWMGAAISLSRAALTLFRNPGPTYLITDVIQTASSLGYLAYIICTAMGVVWMSMQRYESKLIKASERDPLTGLINRRTLERRADELSARARNTGAPLAVILFDVDNLKGVNDAHGRKSGDRMLVELARTARWQLRSQDVLGRFGGGEFLILLPGTPLGSALELAEELRRDLHAAQIEHDGKIIRVTASFGVAVLDETVKDWDMLASSADEALYKARQTGTGGIATCTQ